MKKNLKTAGPIRLAIRTIFTILTVGLMALAGGGWSFFQRPVAVIASVLWIAWLEAVQAGRPLGRGSAYDRKQQFVMGLSSIAMMGFMIAAPWEYAHFSGPIPRDGILAWIGILVFAAGVVIQTYALWIMHGQYTVRLGIQPGHHLVKDGPYRYIRHPGYMSHLMCMLGMSLAFSSLVGLALSLVMIPVLYRRTLTEEAMLEKEFGEEYRAYQGRTGRLLPRI
ncbi:MAG: methyltransferase [Omnitrophica WOR_2 bacterium]